MTNAFVGTIVQVSVKRSPIFAQTFGVERIAVILRRNMTYIGSLLSYRLVVAPVSVFKFIYGCTGSSSQ